MNRILIVDDSIDTQLLMIHYLLEENFHDITVAQNAAEAMENLNKQEFDLILMDIMMPGTDGLEACRQIKELPQFYDLPIIIVTAKTSLKDLEQAFNSGAFDYITKPLTKIELLARVKSAIKLKEESDQRKIREAELLKVKAELEEMNEKLKELSFFDPLTNLVNRRYLDQVLQQIWIEPCEPVTVFMIDIDCFKAYNDAYGHQQGDECLKQVAKGLKGLVKSPGFVARYGGEEFVVVWPGLDFGRSQSIGETLCQGIEKLALEHHASPVKKVVTVSIGMAYTLKTNCTTPQDLIKKADSLLYQSKAQGRNCLCTSQNPNIIK